MIWTFHPDYSIWCDKESALQLLVLSATTEQITDKLCVPVMFAAKTEKVQLYHYQYTQPHCKKCVPRFAHYCAMMHYLFPSHHPLGPSYQKVHPEMTLCSWWDVQIQELIKRWSWFLFLMRATIFMCAVNLNLCWLRKTETGPSPCLDQGNATLTAVNDTGSPAMRTNHRTKAPCWSPFDQQMPFSCLHPNTAVSLSGKCDYVYYVYEYDHGTVSARRGQIKFG